MFGDKEMNNKKVRFGIVGTGTIAHRFAEAIKNVENAELKLHPR